MRMGPIIRIQDEVEKKRVRQEAAAGYLQEWGAAVERQIGTPDVTELLRQALKLETSAAQAASNNSADRW